MPPPSIYHYIPSVGPHSSCFPDPASGQAAATSPRKTPQIVLASAGHLPQPPEQVFGNAGMKGDSSAPVPKHELVIAEKQQITRGSEL